MDNISRSSNTAVMRQDYFMEGRSPIANTEKHFALELVTVANIDSMAPIPTRDELLKMKLPVSDLLRWGIVSPSNLPRDLQRIVEMFQEIQFISGVKKKGQSS